MELEQKIGIERVLNLIDLLLPISSGSHVSQNLEIPTKMKMNRISK